MASGWLKWLIVGGVCASLAQGFEAMGDAAPVIEGGVSGERAGWHGLALLLILVTLACCLRALWITTAFLRGGGGGGGFSGSGPNAGPSEAEPFDPDAALARYMENRPQPAPASEPAPPRQAGFGRKPV